MSSDIPTIWPISEHTKAKHLILQNYIGAWLSIIGQRFNQVLFVDGFCGPGIYSGGELGSPLIAINEAHRALARAAHIVTPFKFDMYFIDEHGDRVENLKSNPEFISRDARVVVHPPIQAEFETAVGPIIQTARGTGTQIPTFVFIDPFGVKGSTLRTLKEILSNPSSEVFMLFDVDGINRLLGDENMMTAVFGDVLASEARAIRDVANPMEKMQRIRGLHRRALIGDGRCCKYYLPFRIMSSDRRELYDLVFLTNNQLGFLKMKEAMWKADSDGAFRFVDSHVEAPMFDFAMWKSELWGELMEAFAGKRVTGSEVTEFVNYKTRFIGRHKTELLREYESGSVADNQRIVVTNRAKKNTYPDGALIQFPKKEG